MIVQNRSAWLLAVVVVSTAACSGEAKREVPPATVAAAPAAPAPSTAELLAGPSATPVQSPDSFRVVFETSKGNFTVTVTRAWAPRGADRFYEMVKVGYFSDVRFFRVVQGFVAQFGMHGDPKVNEVWERAALKDEPRKLSNAKGTIVFATAGPNTRSNQFFINDNDNTDLDAQGFAPFGRVTEGMNIVESLNSEYGEETLTAQSRIADKGNEYLAKWFPALDYIKSAKIVAP